MKRRNFIQRLASTGIVLPIALGMPKLRAIAAAPEGSPFMKISGSNNDNIMILIRLVGGNDGLNTIIPYKDSNYYNLRSSDSVAIAESEVIKLPDSTTLGMHPSFKPLLDLYKEGKMSIIENVAYPNQVLSHFRSTDIWLSASDYNIFENTGWYGKYLEAVHPDYPNVMPKDPFAIEFGQYLSTTCIGVNGNMGVAIQDTSYIPGQPDVTDTIAKTHAGDEEEYVRSIIQQSNVFLNSISDASKKVTANKVTYPTGSQLGASLASVVRLIASGMKTSMYIVNVGGYDTHSDQIQRHEVLLDDLAGCVLALQRDLEAFGLDKKVCAMTISEFGRRPASNGGGSDHGSAAPQFVFGTGVIGGIIGREPNLTDLDENKNIKMQYDFRQIYSSVLGQWYGASESQIQPKPLPRHFDQLPIFEKTTTGVSVKDALAQGVNLGQNFPNPSSNGTIVPFDGIVNGIDATFVLNTMDGKVVFVSQLQPGQTSYKIDTKGLDAGNYIYSIKSGNITKSKVMTVVK